MLETERYAAPVGDPADAPTALAGWRSSAGPCPGSRSGSSTPRPASPRADREVGELEIRGTSVTPGYYGRPDAADELFHDGWLRTGDLAYLLDGELVVCGRIKDVIIVGGRNVFPEDVERAVAASRRRARRQRHRLRRAPAAARKALVVVAETKQRRCRDDPPDRSPSGSARPSACRRRTSCSSQPGTLPKTSSGKLQRGLCRQRYLGEELVVGLRTRQLRVSRTCCGPTTPPGKRQAALRASITGRQRVGVGLVRGVEADAVDHVAVAALQLRRELLGLADDGERVEDLVVDEVAHLDPLALLRQLVELVLQVAPAVELEHAAVRGRRAVERDLLAGAVGAPWPSPPRRRR